MDANRTPEVPKDERERAERHAEIFGRGYLVRDEDGWKCVHPADVMLCEPKQSP